LLNGLEKAKDQDWIIISDLDEIPNLQNNNLKKSNKKIVFFQQQMFYYKFNLRLKNFFWIGSKACKKKYLRSCQWLRNVKDKRYPLWRFDVMFSIKKYFDIEIFKDGGWHFSYIKSPKKIEEKLRSYMHHAEYEQNPLGEKKIKNLVNNRKAIYDLYADSKQNKFTGNNILEKVDLNKLPNYLKKNNKLYDKWIEK
jgi:beta-1,4-mannosyl-glycoprotein beta-1,4-N-acetylglucosaminyltransferase